MTPAAVNNLIMKFIAPRFTISKSRVNQTSVIKNMERLITISIKLRLTTYPKLLASALLHRYQYNAHNY